MPSGNAQELVPLTSRQGFQPAASIDHSATQQQDPWHPANTSAFQLPTVNQNGYSSKSAPGLDGDYIATKHADTGLSPNATTPSAAKLFAEAVWLLKLAVPMYIQYAGGYSSSIVSLIFVGHLGR